MNNIASYLVPLRGSAPTREVKVIRVPPVHGKVSERDGDGKKETFLFGSGKVSTPHGECRSVPSLDLEYDDDLQQSQAQVLFRNDTHKNRWKLDIFRTYR